MRRRRGRFPIRKATAGRNSPAKSRTGAAHHLTPACEVAAAADQHGLEATADDADRAGTEPLARSSAASLLLAAAALERKLIALPQGRERHRRKLLALKRALRRELELTQGLMRTLFQPYAPATRQPV